MLKIVLLLKGYRKAAGKCSKAIRKLRPILNRNWKTAGKCPNKTDGEKMFLLAGCDEKSGR